MADYSRTATINGAVYNFVPLGYCACGCGEVTGYSHGKRCRFVRRHNTKGKNNPNYTGGKNTQNGYSCTRVAGHPKGSLNGYVYDHVLTAEKALGKYLPPNAVVHHDGKQLVVCQDQAYHMLLHRRKRALEACGHANWLKCRYCKEYDDPKNLVVEYYNGWIRGRHRKENGICK